MGLIGHNRGPALQPGAAWRRHCWTAAREALLPVLPVEVVRMRVKYARAMGLEYKTYASVRAATGHDLVAFLFSSNALRLIKGREVLPADRAAKLAGLACTRIALATAPLQPARILQNPELDSVAGRSGVLRGALLDQRKPVGACGSAACSSGLPGRSAYPWS